jgi:hypothetical protein
MSHIRIVPRVITGTPQGLSPGYQRQEYCNRSRLLALIIHEVAAGPSGPLPPERRYRPLPATAASPAARRGHRAVAGPLDDLVRAELVHSHLRCR